ncbi:SLC13 family permease [Sphingomonas aestuarii]
MFVAVYIGMATGGFPRLKVDRAWIAVAGATLLIVTHTLSVETAAPLVEIDAIVLLLGLMILSAQFDLAEFYGRCAEMVVRNGDNPARLLALVVALGGFLSAFLVNDIVVFALTPVLCAGVRA